MHVYSKFIRAVKLSEQDREVIKKYSRESIALSANNNSQNYLYSHSKNLQTVTK